LAPTSQGVVIGGVARKSPAAGISLVPGDVVVSINRQPVSDPALATSLLKIAVAEGDVLLLVNRHGDSQFVVLAQTADLKE
jgi:serine protease Do